ncbi:V-type ATP synthase subunit E [Streptomyces sp. ME18-1-4]|uniref:V-type ATP synthase subunit E n=1 Tax=Streptomyces sp. ME18-1-4 TaxID=3028685 RepID=UPI0029B3654C|nr:V-type ATP synthase subunit E [Streptomyces sp. ME18-1-4]MDX3242153.1 V-type ATP synthase subunit E [Streptomyces sp. ME18-1-4]
MTTPAPQHTTDALSPVRAGLLRAAHADAEAVLSHAEREAAALLDQARAEARAILDEARRQGEADGSDAARDLLVRARREATSRTLSARREAYEELRREAAERVRALRRTDGYASLREWLEQRTRVLLGPAAEVSEHADGGVVARAPGKRVDLSLTALADRALDRMRGEVRSLWEP